MKIIENPDLSKIYLSYPRHVCVVGVWYEDKVNLMPASWNSPISFNPPIVGVAISPQRYTFYLLTKAKMCSISFFTFEHWKVVNFLGTNSAKDINKIEKVQIPIQQGKKLRVPITLNSAMCMECEIIDAREYGDHWWFVAKVVLIHYDENVSITIKDNIIFPNLEKFLPILYLGRQQYITINPQIFSPERK